MSEAHVESIRRIFDAWGRGDFRVGADLYDPHVLLVIRPEFPEAGVYRGPAEIRRYTKQLLAAWDAFAIAGEEFISAGDSVVVGVRQHGTGAGSGLATELRYFQVWTFRGKSVIRIESVRERSEALEAVGREDRLPGAR
jgi:ketosteroid isomerase-like protein